MQAVWFKGLNTKTAKEERRKELLSYRQAFEALQEHLRQWEKHTTGADYNSPSWAYKQADQIGYNRAIQDVLKLIDIKEK